MQSISRRTVIRCIAALGAMQTLERVSIASAQDTDVERVTGQRNLIVPVLVDWDRTVAQIPADMLGLSYESSQLSAPDFFSPANTELIGLFRTLTPRGVLRLGGNLSEYTAWTPNFAQTPNVPFRTVGADPSSGGKIRIAQISKQSITNLNGFLEQTGWRAVYGLRLAKADMATVAEEAEFVSRILGSKLIAFQIGNEPDHYVLNKLRLPGYNFDKYFAEWSVVHDAVRARIPTAKFAGPDIAEDLTWICDFAKRAPKSVTMLTGHHYAEGPPIDPAMTIERLLAPDADFNKRLAKTIEICRDAKLPYVMAETNSCYNAGKKGVSDVFASALWSLDYLLQLAAAGQQGAYFHGGASGWYTPIAGGAGTPFHARPIFHGLQMASSLLGSEMMTAKCVIDSKHISVYAFRNPRRLVVINKGGVSAVLQIRGDVLSKPVQVQRLSAPSLDAREHIAFSAELLPRSAPLTVPRFSAAVFQLT